MDVNTATQIMTVALAVLTIIWHQQRTTDKLRDRLDSVIQRLARIEGFFGISNPVVAGHIAESAGRE